MAEGFINIEIESDPEVLRQQVYELIQAQFPDWDPAKATLDKFIVDGCSLMSADLGDIAGVVPKEVLRQFGVTIYRIPALGAESAVATVTIKLKDAAGYPTIKAGTQMMLQADDGTKRGFRTREDIEVPVGSAEIKGVVIEAIEPGAQDNGLEGNPEMLDSVSYIASVEQTSENTKGGRDAETPDEYLDRLTTELELLSTTVIVPSDYEKLARRFGMYRAVAIDGWDPEAETEENERMISVAAVDEEGEGWTEEKKEEYKAEAESMREINFIVHVIDPTYNEINVSVEVMALPGFDAVTVQEAVEEALANYLDPGNWANSPGEPRAWRQNTVVRKSELIWLINTVPGVDYIIDPLKLSKGADPLAEVDVALTGKATLTKPKTLTVKVTEP